MAFIPESMNCRWLFYKIGQQKATKNCFYSRLSLFLFKKKFLMKEKHLGWRLSLQ